MPSAQKITFREILGIFALIFIFAGFASILAGWIVTYHYPSPITIRWESGVDWFPIIGLLLIPFAVQVIIFCKFDSISKTDKELGFFFKVYSTVMCFGLSSYSLLWLAYASIPSHFLDNFSEYALNFFSVLSLIFIAIMVWMVVLCTQIITKDPLGNSKELLDLSSITQGQYKLLCGRLNAILNSESILAKKPEEITKILTDADATEDHDKINQIIKAFSDLGKIPLPLNEIDTNEIDKIRDILLDKNPPARIKPLKRILLFLRNDLNTPTRDALEKKNFSGVSRNVLIKNLSKILIDSHFYGNGEDFKAGDSKTPEKSAISYFHNSRKKYSIDKILEENRKLLDTHVLKFLTVKGHDDDDEEEDDTSKLPPPKHGVWASFSDFFMTRARQIMKMGLSEEKELKIKEGITKFPLTTLAFFFTIFVCVLYLFAFAFAFHDRATLKDSAGHAHALFMSNDFLPKIPAGAVNKAPAADVQNGGGGNIAPGAQTASPAVPEIKLEKFQTSFLYYRSREAGVLMRDMAVPNGRSTSGREDKNSGLQKFEFDIYSTNKKNFNSLLSKLKQTADTSKKVFVEIVGRADDAKVMENSPYSSNFELSLARAQNIKFELIRALQKSPKILEKIEWSCLPVSNDGSIGGDYPLNSSENRPSIAVQEINSDAAEVNDASRKIAMDLIRDQKNSIKLPGNTGDKVYSDLNAQKRLLDRHTDKASELIRIKKIDSQNMVDKIQQYLQNEINIYNKLASEEIVMTKYEAKKEELQTVSAQVEEVLGSFESGDANTRKRITEIFITSIPETNDPIPAAELNLMDYVLFTFTASGYGDIKAVSMFAKFILILVSLVQVFFVVVFFNILMSVKKGGQEDYI